MFTIEPTRASSALSLITSDESDLNSENFVNAPGAFYICDYDFKTGEALPEDLPIITDYFHDKVAEKLNSIPNFEAWKNYISSFCNSTYVINKSFDTIKNLSLDNAYLPYHIEPTSSGGNCLIEFQGITFWSKDISPTAKADRGIAYVSKGSTQYYASHRGIGYGPTIEVKKLKVFPMEQINEEWLSGSGDYILYDENCGVLISDDEGDIISTPCSYNLEIVRPNREDDYDKRKFFCNTSGNLSSKTYTPLFPTLFSANCKRLLLGGDKMGFIKISDLSFHDLVQESGSEFFWEFSDVISDVGNRSDSDTDFLCKGPICSVDTSTWKVIPHPYAYVYIAPMINPEYYNYIKEGDEIIYDIELEDKNLSYEKDDYKFINGIAKNIHQKIYPTNAYSQRKEIFIPLIKYPFSSYEKEHNCTSKSGITIIPKKLPNHFAAYDYKPHLTLEWGDYIMGYLDLYYTTSITTGKLVFTLTLTGMGNDPCKQCCSCEIEDKKYETVIEFTSDEALQDKVTIDPADLEYSWAENTLTVMLAEGETVTVDNIPAGVKYKITVNSDDPCDENEYNVDNGDGSNEGTIGEDAEGNPQEETEVQIEAQRGETLEEYLERLRQKGYEALAESLKLENVEFTLQDERIKLGDLVTVDMPEFDFKAVVRVTGVKLKSQDNQTIRTISVGTPLKILRKPRI